MKINIEIKDIEKLDAALEKKLNSLNKKERLKILRKAALPMREDARSLISDAPDDVHRYDTPKVLGKLRAPKGTGRKVATYVPGNLRKSINILNLRKTTSVFLGPRTKKGNRTGTFGVTAGRVDAYYAAMIHNGTRDIKGVPFMSMAFEAKKGEALQIITAEMKKIIEK